jgi:TRAP-type C4-dicarboxylate transport system permease small subunit
MAGRFTDNRWRKNWDDFAVILRIVDRLMWGIERVLAYAFIAAVALNFINVVGRYGFGITLLSADEIQIFIMVFMTFLGAAVVAWRGQHLRMDVLVNTLPASLRRLVQIFELAAVAVLAGFVLWNSTYYAQQMFNFGRVSDMGRVPMWIPHGAVAAGFGLIAFVACVRLVQIVTGRLADSDKSPTEI